MYELPKNQMVPKCPVCGFSELRRKRDATFAASWVCHCTCVKGIKLRCCLLFLG